MPEKHVPPLWLLALLSAVLGLVAQLGTSLAMDMAKDKGKLYGFLLLSLVFSASTTVLLVQLTALDDYVCATVGTLAGAIPPLWTLRAAVKLIGQKYGVELGELTNPAGPAAPQKEGDAT
ncbi:hypothetical protein GCM10017784_09960 [Deinococcus indicus]|uniref:hypothetical protein n=1 Tax=Deinococcus indicus TaxID=223556 RepID=UPI00174809E9|nr:hypothetical protein [Deinococcus indicus]GHG20522.1 hypothetical protein GCM10017784_09960 [Deinococcus indicus]